MSAFASKLQALKWRRTFLHPSVLLPVLFGILGLAANSFVSDPMCSMIGAGGLAMAGAAIVYRSTVGADGIVDQARIDLINRRQRTHKTYLRELRRRMRRDRDPRTGQLVTKLRTIYEHLEQSEESAGADYSGVLPQMHEQARELYDSCLKLLEHSFQLWDTGRSLADEENQESLASEREVILGEVQQSVEHLDRTMDELRKASLRRDQPANESQAKAEHAHLRDELSLGIETARSVEQRMNDLEEELGMRGRV